MTYKISTNSPAASLALGERLAKLLKGGEVIELISDLGGGKTVIVKGLAKGLGYDGPVTSPTFTISRVYNLPSDKQLHHFDFYRLAAGDIVDQELAEVMGDPNVITAIEWAEHSGDALPADRITVSIKRVDETTRGIEITGPESVIKGLQL